MRLRLGVRKVKKKVGPNSVVEIANGVARKILKQHASREKRERFNHEIEILQRIKATGVDNIVEVTDADLEDDAPWYEMKAYPGDSNELLPLTRGNPERVVELLLPVVRTLHMLAIADTPVYHRDLKPDNLLFDGSVDAPRLVLADFGCAFLKTDDEDRLTQEFRGVGAMAYRAPEYHHGRVDDVDEKGDIFSIGKLLWFFVNGIRYEVFPYTLWYPPEYDLARRFPDVAGIDRLNLIIASAVHHDPERRVRYRQLIDSLERLLQVPDITPEEGDQIRIQEHEARLQLELEQTRAATRSLLNVFFEDLSAALANLRALFPGSQPIEALHKSYPDHPSLDQIVTTIVDQESSYPLWDPSHPSLHIRSRIFTPSHFADMAGVQPDCPSIQMVCETVDPVGDRRNRELYWYYKGDAGIMQILDGETSRHDRANMLEVLREVLLHRAGG